LVKAITRKLAIALVIALVLGGGISFYSLGILAPSKNHNVLGCRPNAGVRTIDGYAYCVSDVTDDVVIPNPGFGYFLNESVTYMGVKFVSICPHTSLECAAGLSSDETIPPAAAMNVVLTFQDGTNETIGGVIGLSSQFSTFSTHVSPRVGLEILWANTGYDVFLLVEQNG
jgi:hypothetical protein